jgi:polyisoprenoid-binding protein YceI
LRALVLVGLLGLVLAAPAQTDPLKAAAAPAGAYALDPQRARLTARVRIGLFRYAMRFNRLSGSFAYDPTNWRATRVAITVDPKSVDSGWARANVMEPAKYPVIRFVSSEVLPAGGGRGRLTGELTLHGVTRPVTLDFVFRGADDSTGEPRLVFAGTGKIRRSDFRLAADSPFAGDEVELRFEVEFAKVAEQASSRGADRAGAY